VPEDLKSELRTLTAAEQWERALVLLVSRAEEVDADPRLHWEWGWTLFKLKRLDEAAHHLALACAVQPSDPVSLWALAVVQRELGRHIDAEANFLRALEEKDSYLARVGLATMYFEQGRLADAEAVHREGVRLRPSHRERLEALADFLDDTGRAAESRGLREEAERLPTREERRGH
jgi:Flp pilus assembly protein TadD